jgi:hypothetical protein
MDVIRRADLERLALQRAGPSVSLFLPSRRAGPEVQQAPIRLKNLLREATEALQADGVRPPMIDSVLAPLRRLVNDGLFWQYQSDGLALYSRPGWWRALRVPLDLPELAVVADRFHISPLLPLLTGDGHFFVLALSQHQIRLLEGTRDRLEEVHLPGVPLGVRDALQGKEAQRQLQLYVADRGGVAARGIFHGHGSAGDLQTERVLRYFRKVNRALREVLAGEHAPMVLAAVEHLAPLWRRVNTYPHLVDPVFAGSPEEVLFAARHPTGVAATNGGPSPNGERALRDVLELAAVTTLLKGGTVYALPAGAVPEGGSAAAVMRYWARVPQDRIG